MTGFPTTTVPSPDPIIKNQNSNNERLIESIESLNNTIESMDASATKYSNALLGISLIMMVMALLQIILTVISFSFLNWTLRGFILIIVLVIFLGFVKYIVSNLERKSGK